MKNQRMLCAFIICISITSNLFSHPDKQLKLSQAPFDRGKVPGGKVPADKLKSSEEKKQAIAGHLEEALRLRQQIRAKLFKIGRRLTKDVIAEYKGQFEGSAMLSFLFGFGGGGGSMRGNFEGKAYQELLKDGEFFIVPVSADTVQNFVQQSHSAQRAKGVPFSRCLRQLLAVTTSFAKIQDVAPLEQNLERFQKVLDQLDIETSNGFGTEFRPPFENLRAWAQGSSIDVVIVNTIHGFSFTGGSRGCYVNFVGVAFHGPEQFGKYRPRTRLCDTDNNDLPAILQNQFRSTSQQLRVY